MAAGLWLESPDVERVDEAVVQIGCEWLADHLIAKCLIDRCGDIAQLTAALTTDDAHAISSMTPRGAPLYVLSVFWSERFGVELPDGVIRLMGESQIEDKIASILRYKPTYTRTFDYIPDQQIDELRILYRLVI